MAQFWHNSAHDSAGERRPLATILHIIGARPNFMKMAAVHRAALGRLDQVIVHTGQHYDWPMSGVFFEELGIPAPDVNPQAGSGTHATQTAEIMIRIEPLLARYKPDLVVVYGDVNSTVAAALVSSKLGLPVAHVEAGLRSRDRSMPEEINRIVTDAVADILFTPSQDANDNLAAEGVPGSRVHLVGNVMIDTLIRLLPRTSPDEVRSRLGIEGRFALVTLHRPSNVDDPSTLRRVLAALARISDMVEVVFPVHPRTGSRIGADAPTVSSRIRLIEPLGYLDFLALQQRAALVITDSGGIQEETTFLGVPCLTVRDNTERPVTITHGTNVLVGRGADRLVDETVRVLETPAPRRTPPPLWDGCAGERIAALLAGLPTAVATC
jgi:UDP-N-acetylglucosamine 2-epimerase (non-hydrolysing)